MAPSAVTIAGDWRRLSLSTGFQLAGWLLGAGEAYLILFFLGIPADLVVATVIEALGAGVRFATFLVPASLGAFESANAAAFEAMGLGAGRRTRVQLRAARAAARVDRHRPARARVHGVAREARRASGDRLDRYLLLDLDLTPLERGDGPRRQKQGQHSPHHAQCLAARVAADHDRAAAMEGDALPAAG